MTDLVHPECVRLGTHQILWNDKALCCLDGVAVAGIVDGQAHNGGAGKTAGRASVDAPELPALTPSERG